MAKTFTLKSHSYDGRYLELSCTQTQDISNNNSTINWTLTSTGGSVNYYTVGPTTVTIGGMEVYYKASTSYSSRVFPAAKGSTSGTLTVPHNSDGGKSLMVSLSTAIYNGVVNTASNTWTLDSNPRKATLISAPNFKDMDNPTISYSNLIGNNAELLEAGIYSADGNTPYAAYRSISKTDTEYTFTLTDSERSKIRAAMTNTNTLQIEFVLRTTINGSTYTDVLYRTITLSDDGIIIEPTVKDINTRTIALTGDDSKLIKFFSTAQASMNIATSHGAAITQTLIKNGPTTVNATSTTFKKVESNVFAFGVTDSRGKTELEFVYPEMIEYIRLTCNIKVNPLTAHGNTTININGSFYNGKFVNTKNVLKVQYRYKEEGSVYSAWKTARATLDGNSYSSSVEITGLDYRKTYKFQAHAVDSLDTNGINSKQWTVSSIPVFEWGKEDFQFNVPVTFKGDITLEGNFGGDYVIEQGEKDGWLYRNWHSGKGECWKTITITSAIDQAWGVLYGAGTKMTRQNYPFPFKTKPIENASLQSSGAACFLYPESGGDGVNSS